tara:strand:- start:547 stop:1041 length:495 start_codon:yes stop_codon:yes gene_type:complete
MTTRLPFADGFQKYMEKKRVFTKDNFCGEQKREVDSFSVYFMYLWVVITIIMHLKKYMNQRTVSEFSAHSLELLVLLFVEMYFIHAYVNCNLLSGFFFSTVYYVILTQLIYLIFGKPNSGKPKVKAKPKIQGGEVGGEEVKSASPEPIDADVEKNPGENSQAKS